MTDTFTGGMPSMSRNPLSAAVVTQACAREEIATCWGFINPIANGDGIPCQHVSHDNGTGNARNYGNALESARKLAETMTGTREPMTSDRPRGSSRDT
jgi:hypothetical protein